MLEIATWWGDTLLDHELREDDEPFEARAGAVITVGRPVVLRPRPAEPFELDLRMFNAWLVAAFAHGLFMIVSAVLPKGAAPFDAERGLLNHPVLRLAAALPKPAAAERASPKKDLRGLVARAGAGAVGKKRRGGVESAKESWLGALNAAVRGDGRGELEAALAGVGALEIGGAGGIGIGTGTRGGGPGAYALGTIGIGSSGLPRGERPTFGALPNGDLKKTNTEIEINLREPTIIGGYDKKVLHEHIRRHIPQIRYCYERELMMAPSLGGKISVRFTIGPDGRVSSASIDQSNIDRVQLERCMLEKIKTWSFPAVGGHTEVRYPFILHAS